MGDFSLFEPYLDPEYLNVIEYIRTNKNTSGKLKTYICQISNASTIRLGALFADFNLDLGKIRAEHPQLLDIKECIKFLDNNLKVMTVMGFLEALQTKAIVPGDVVRVRGAKRIIGPEYYEKSERKTLPLEGSFLEYNSLLETARIMSKDHLQAEFVEVTDAGSKRAITRILFRDVDGAKSFFAKNPRPQFSEVFGMVENVPTYTSKIEGNMPKGELSMGILVSLLRVEIEAEPVTVKPEIKMGQVRVYTSGEFYAPSVPISGSGSIGTFSSISYQACFTCPKCGYKYVPFIVPTKCPSCGYMST